MSGWNSGRVRGNGRDRKRVHVKTGLIFAIALLSLAAGDGGRAAPAADPLTEFRSRQLLAGPWRFTNGSHPVDGANVDCPDGTWDEVQVPHTWSGPGGNPTFREAWYRIRFNGREGLEPGGRVYLYFEGAAAIIDVFVNGVSLGQHRGAYTAAVFDATEAIKPQGADVLAVKISNDRTDTVDCLPSGNGRQLYRVYGGLYRKVWLLRVPACHVYPEMASPGVYVSTKALSEATAELSIRTVIRNGGGAERTVVVRHRLLDAQGRIVATLQGTADLKPGATADCVTAGTVSKPRLWSPSNPHLYTVRTELLDDGQPIDAVTTRTGLRTIRIDKEKGFLLNDKPILIRGVNKHQETEYKLTAVDDDDLREDWRNLKELGVNCVRLCHYPHSRLEYDLADEAGILVWAENGHSNEGAHSATGDRITREMVRQNFNHPSIVFWSCGNEALEEAAGVYAQVIQEEDRTRLTTYASNGQHPQPTDFIAFNIYPYWYVTQAKFEPGARPFSGAYIAEHGAGGVISTHTAYGAEAHRVDHFEPEEWQQLVHEWTMPALFRHEPEKCRMYLLWVMRDLGDGKYRTAVNTKGLLTYSNFRKDSFYLLQSYLRPEHPVLHICGKTHFVRQNEAGKGLKVYSNLPALGLKLNGQDLGRKDNGQYMHPAGMKVDNVFFWDITLQPGRNDVEVSDGHGRVDQAVLYHMTDGKPLPEESSALVQELSSSNPSNRVCFVADRIRDQWPVYYPCDGQADNTFDVIPEPLRGAGRIATRRLSDPQNVTTLSFTISARSKGAEVYVLHTANTTSTLPGVRRDLSKGSKALSEILTQAGFVDAGFEGLWRDNNLALVGCRAMVRHCRPGERVTIPGTAHDYVVLVKSAGSSHE